MEDSFIFGFTYVATAPVLALQGALQLALEQVHDHRLISQQVAGPRLPRVRCIILAGGIHALHIRLLQHAVQVLVQAVQQKGEKLLRVD